MFIDRYRLKLLILCVIISCKLHAFEGKIDSLNQVLKQTNEDTSRIKIYFQIASTYMRASDPRGTEYLENIKTWAEKNEHAIFLAQYHNLMGRWYKSKGITKQAVESFEQELKIQEQLNDSIGMASCYNNLGTMLTDQGYYNRALNYHLDALKVREKLKDERGLANSYHNIGMIYDNQKKYDDALENYFRSLALKEKVGDKGGAANTLSNISLIFIEKQLFDSSLIFSNKALENYAILGDSSSIYIINTNIAFAYQGKKEYNKAIKAFQNSLAFSRRAGSVSIESYCYQGLGDTYKGKNEFPQAISFYHKALRLFKEMQASKEVSLVYKGLSECYQLTGEPQKAYDYLNMFQQLNDTLLLENNEKIVAEMQEKYESTQKQQENALLREQGKIKDLQRNVFIGIGGLLTILAFFMYKNIRDKQKANKALHEKNEIISEQKDAIEVQRDAIEKQKNNIIDSIKYAKRIQESFLVSKEHIYSKFEDAFVLYKPRDIVSGDFYWFAEKNGKLLLAAVDCTGHGVPGALMSMLGNRLLNEIVHIQGEVIPGKILEKLHLGVVHDLQQSIDSPSQDGMDMFICAVDQKNGSIEYAGAVNPAILVENGELIQLKSTFLSIGGVRQNETSHHRTYETISRPLVKNSTIYMFSDGYIDQFNGKIMKKFGSSNLKKFVEANHSYPLQEQMIKFDENIENWRENYRQMDDILMMGIKIS